MVVPHATIHLPVVGPFEVAPAMALLSVSAVPGAETTDLKALSCTRFITLPDATSTQVTVSLRPDHVDLLHAGLAGSDLDHVTAAVRGWLDLDADPGVIEQALGTDPMIGTLVGARPGLRVIGCPDGFEAAVTTILGQHVSVAAARTFSGRAVAAFGGAPRGEAGLRPFPSPAALSAAAPSELQSAIGVTHARARSIHALADVCADGLAIEPAADGPELRRALLALPGIGPWTLELMAVRALGDRDGYPAGDLVLQRALGVSSTPAARAAAAAWSPFRAYALFHLWCHALGI